MLAMPEINTEEARRYLEYARDPGFTREMAAVFGNDEPAPAQHAIWDSSLRGTPTKAYYVNPEEIAELYHGGKQAAMQMLERELGTTMPYIALNPDLLQMPKDFVYSVIDHEKAHGGQPKGKLALLGINAYTPGGNIPIGRMIVEGWNEYGLERKRKSPSCYFDEMYGRGKTAYSQFRDFVYEIEEQSPGITRQIMRAARKGGPNAAIRLIESIPNIGNIATKYASNLNNRMN